MKKNKIVFVVRAVFKFDNKYLVVKQKNASNNEYLMFPGGHKKLGETLEEALKREINEEIIISNFKIQGINFINETLTVFDRSFEIFFNCSTCDNPNNIKPRQKKFIGFEKISECALFDKNYLQKSGIFFPIGFFNKIKYQYNEIDINEYKKRFGVDRNMVKFINKNA